MIDFFKIRTTTESPDQLIHDSDLEFFGSYKTVTGEIIDRWTATLGNIELNLFSSGLFILKGSIHKYFNEGIQNYSDFTIKDFIYAIEDLSNHIGLNLWKFTLDTLEVGVNIIPPIATNIILDRVYLHKTKVFKNVAVGSDGDYRQAVYSDYFVKIYDKGKQYRLPKDMLRFEIKLKADMLRKMGINLLADTVDRGNITMLTEHLMVRFREIVFIDPTIKTDEMTPKQKARVEKWQNPRYWTELQKNPPSKNSFANEIRILRRLTERYSDNIQDQIEALIKEKLGELAGDLIIDSGIDCGKNSPRVDLLKHQSSGNNGSSNIDSITPDNRICKITGYPIWMQKNSSHFISATGVRWHFNNDPIAFEWLRDEYLPERWKNDSLEIQFKKIAQAVRHRSSDTRRSLMNQYYKLTSNLCLFPFDDFIDSKILHKYEVPTIVIQHYGISRI